jgi:hypothetical protein
MYSGEYDVVFFQAAEYFTSLKHALQRPLWTAFSVDVSNVFQNRLVMKMGKRFSRVK